jgi:ribosomal protein S18 acetylase RimI-like enzyme
MAFYAQHGMQHVHAEMLALGHAYGIRDEAGHLTCAGGLHFAIVDRYAQLGGLVTVPHARGRSCATRVLEAICSSLAAAGVQRCGLFADGDNPALLRFYAARGYRTHGRFAFRTLR